jgi:hypothetical protein
MHARSTLTPAIQCGLLCPVQSYGARNSGRRYPFPCSRGDNELHRRQRPAQQPRGGSLFVGRVRIVVGIRVVQPPTISPRDVTCAGQVATQAEHLGALAPGFKGRLTAVLLAAVLLAGCTAPAVNTGPFHGGGDPGEECASIAPGGVMGYGFEEFSNSGSATATIEKVALTDPRGLRILAAYVVPVSGHILYGVQPGWPPGYLPPGFHWPQREKAVGARIPPSPGHDVINLLRTQANRPCRDGPLGGRPLPSLGPGLSPANSDIDPSDRGPVVLITAGSTASPARPVTAPPGCRLPAGPCRSPALSMSIAWPCLLPRRAETFLSALAGADKDGPDVLEARLARLGRRGASRRSGRSSSAPAGGLRRPAARRRGATTRPGPWP